MKQLIRIQAGSTTQEVMLDDSDDVTFTLIDDGEQTTDSELASFSVVDLLGREGPCFRCDEHVTSQVEVAYLGTDGRTDCPESEDGAPHEIDEPE